MELTKEQQLKLYTNMVRVRKLDEFMVKASHEGKLVALSFLSQQGQEAIGVGACTFLRDDDYIFYTHRGLGLDEVISKGHSARAFIAEHYGKATGSCNGLSGIYTCDLERGILGLAGTLPDGATESCGVGLVAKFKGKGQVVASFCGDGTSGRGPFYEALLMSANWKLPVILL